MQRWAAVQWSPHNLTQSRNEPGSIRVCRGSRQMLKFSLIVLFVMSMATLTIAASHMPLPPKIFSGKAHTPTMPVSNAFAG
jgi:hypothetical protein